MARTTTVRVVAPATLEAGFTFDVLLQGEPYTVTVPAGGVEQGQEFDIPYHDKELTETGTLGVPSGSQEEDDKDPLDAPMGHWRHSLLSCYDVVTQATFWMSCFCIPVMLAQIATRLGLNFKGLPADTPQEASLSFTKIVFSFIVVLVSGYIIPIAGYAFLLTYILILLLWVGRNLRRSIRQRYDIGAWHRLGRYESIEDGLCMCACCCCSLIQMARQTHNDKEYPGLCCTTTGLELNAPLVATRLPPPQPAMSKLK